MARGEYTINELYQPGYASFNPGNSPNYLKQQGLIKAGEFGTHTNPTVANQISELSKVLNAGVIPVEVGTIDMRGFDSVPKDHWTEMRRKADLTGSKLTMHSPLVDPAGFDERNKWGESQQKLAERQLMDVMDKAAELTSRKNPEAVPVTIHAGNYAGSTYKYDINPETGKREKMADQLIAVNRDTGDLAPMTGEYQYEPLMVDGKLKKEFLSPERAIQAANNTQWRKEIDEILQQKESVDKLMSNSREGKEDVYNKILSRERDPNTLTPTEERAFFSAQNADAHLNDAELKLRTAFDKAYKYASDDPIIEKDGKIMGLTKQEKIKILDDAAKTYSEQVKNIGNSEWKLQAKADAIQVLAERMRDANPNMFQRVEEFAIDKASDTLSNVAMHTYEKAKDKNIAPKISLENLYQGMGFSQGQDLKDMVEESRKKFQTALMKEKGLSSTQAEKQAEQMIGVTFDVGHLNLSRKHGFTTEDMQKEAEMVAKYVNKVHLTDNFGYSDSHLPIGMGNVPVKELLESLGDTKGFIKIHEDGGFRGNFGHIAFKEGLEAAGSPIYSSGTGPYWSQATGFQQSYSGGFGTILPSVNYEVFGAGFATMPAELGGSRGAGAGGRLGGGGV